MSPADPAAVSPRGLRRHLPSWGRDWAADSSFLLLSNVLTMVLTTLLAILIARNLDPADWGVFSGFLALGLAVSIVVDFGLGTWLLRELTALWADPSISPEEGRFRAGSLSTHAALISGAIGGASVLVALAYTLARGRPSLAVVAGGLLVYGALMGVANGLDAYLRSLRRIRLVVAFTLTEKGLLVVLVAAGVLEGLAVEWIAVAYVVAGSVRLALVWLTVFARGGVMFVRPHWQACREVVSGSLPFALSTAALNVIPRLDSFVLLAISATSAGYFAMGERVLGPAMLVPVALSITLYPFLSREAHGARSVHPLSALLGAFGLMLAIVGVVLAPVLIPLIFGDQYRTAIGVVQVTLLVLPFVYASNPLLAQLYVRGNEHIVLKVTIIVSLLGTALIVGGQLLSGPQLAAVGLVLRQAMILVSLLAIDLTRSRSSGSRRRVPVDNANM